MQVDFLTVLVAVVSLIIIAIPGFIVVKTKLIDGKVSAAFSALVLYVCAPAQVYMGFQKEKYSSEIGLNMLIVAAVALVAHLLMIGLMFLAIRIKDNDDEKLVAKKRVARTASVFGNSAYMGLPFLQILFPGNGEVIIYASVILSIFNILTWTLGVYMITGNKKDISLKKVLFHPVIIAIVLGFITFVVAKYPLKDLCAGGSTGDLILENLVKSINFIGDMVTPLAMFVIGMRLANVNMKQLFLDKWAYVVTVFKLLVMAVLTMLLCAFLPVNDFVKYALFFLLSMPSAASCALLSVQFNSDGDFASVSVLLSTMISILSIPVMFLLFSAMI